MSWKSILLTGLITITTIARADDTLKSIVEDPHHLPLLEKAINDLETIGPAPRQLSSPEWELKSITPVCLKIANDVADVLGTHITPTILDSSYSPIPNKRGKSHYVRGYEINNRPIIFLGQEARTREGIQMVCAHEIVHAIQQQRGKKASADCTGLLGSMLNACARTNLTLAEGHARIVTRHITTNAYQRTREPDYLEIELRDSLSELRRAYTLSCSKNNAPCDESLFEPNPSCISEYTIGNALFTIRHAQWGDRVYHDMLEGDLCTILHSPEEKDCE